MKVFYPNHFALAIRIDCCQKSVSCSVTTSGTTVLTVILIIIVVVRLIRLLPRSLSLPDRWSGHELGELETVFEEVLFDGIGPAGHFDDGAVPEVLAEERGVDGGRHEDDAQVRVRVHHVAEQDQCEVSVRVTLVDLDIIVL